MVKDRLERERERERQREKGGEREREMEGERCHQYNSERKIREREGVYDCHFTFGAE